MGGISYVRKTDVSGLIRNLLTLLVMIRHYYAMACHDTRSDQLEFAQLARLTGTCRNTYFFPNTSILNINDHNHDDSMSATAKQVLSFLYLF